MAVEARFFVQEITQNASSGRRVLLKASTRGPHDWSKWTPSGTLEMGVLNEAAGDWFAARLGKDLAVCFSDVDEQVHQQP